MRVNLEKKPHIEEEDEFDDDDDDYFIEETAPRQRTLVDDYFDIAMEKFNKDIEEMYDYPEDNPEEEDSDTEKPKTPAQSEPSKTMTTLKEFDSVFVEFLKNRKKDREPLTLDSITTEKKAADPITMKHAYIADSESEELEEVTIKERKQEWDCESILSTYSNLENHPALILEPENRIKLNKRVFPSLPTDLSDEDSENEKEPEDTEKRNLGITRSKAETPEEKKQRKKIVKAEKKIKREQKKDMKLIYKTEILKQRSQGIGQIEGRTIIHFS